MEEVMTRAQADLKATQAAIYETALPLYKKYFPNGRPATLADKHKVTAAVLDKLAARASRQQHDRGLREKGRGRKRQRSLGKKEFVTVPDKPLDIIVMPEFKRGAPGWPIAIRPDRWRKTAKRFSRLEPTPKDWPEERKKSFYREYNNYMMRDLVVHEAMPGHYLQLAHSNQFKAPTLVRAIFQSGSMIEGWAVYMEQAMAEHGFGGPEVKMEQLKMRLRVIVNAIIDQGIHAGKMTEQEALDLMEKEAFPAGRRGGREMETGPHHLGAVVDLLHRGERMARSARARPGESGEGFRREEIQRPGAQLRESAGEIHSCSRWDYRAGDILSGAPPAVVHGHGDHLFFAQAPAGLGDEDVFQGRLGQGDGVDLARKRLDQAGDETGPVRLLNPHFVVQHAHFHA